jgi:hypothetical protein
VCWSSIIVVHIEDCLHSLLIWESSEKRDTAPKKLNNRNRLQKHDINWKIIREWF